jgi:hypothetical protein
MSWQDILKSDYAEQKLQVFNGTRNFMKGYNDFYAKLEVGEDINEHNKGSLKHLMDRIDMNDEIRITRMHLRSWQLKKHTEKVVHPDLFAEIEKLWKESFPQEDLQ